MAEANGNTILTRTRVGEWLTDLVSRAETGISVTKVFRLYQEDFGEHFPMRQLGCWNPVKALESLPEYVSVETSPETGEKFILPASLTEAPVQAATSRLDNKHINDNDNCDNSKKPMLKPHRGTFQLTFINHFQLEKSVLLDYFQQQQGYIGANILSGLKRRCFVSYRREQDALDAFENLKGNETLVELDVADDCKMGNYEDQLNLEEEIPEIYTCRGTFQLSFTTTKFINIGDISSIFSTYGQVAEVCSNFRKIKGKARVFVKYGDKIQAITALRQLKHQFDDLGVANCCQKDVVREVTIPVGKDGTFSVRFKNIGLMGDIFRRHEIYQMFGQFGEVTGVKTDIKSWTYIKYSKQVEAMAAYQEFSLAQNLPSFGIAEQKDDPTNTSFVKKTKFEVEESDMEIFISNFPAKIGVNKLRKIFTNFQEITFREFKVNNTKAFCFAQLPDYEEIKRAVREMHGSIHYNRNLIVRAKNQEVHERIEAELLEEMTAEREMMVNEGDEDWEVEASEDNVYYHENILPNQLPKPKEPKFEGHPIPSSQIIPTIKGNRPAIIDIEANSTHKPVPSLLHYTPPAIPTPTSNTPELSFQTPPPPTPSYHSQTPLISQQISQAKPFLPPTIPSYHSQPSQLNPATLLHSLISPPPQQNHFTYPQPSSSEDYSKPPPLPSFTQPPPPIRGLPLSSGFRKPISSVSVGQKQCFIGRRPSLTKPPQRQSFICHNPGLKVKGIQYLSQPATTPVSVSQDSGYRSIDSSMMSKFDNLSEIKVSVDNNLFSPQTGSRKRKSEAELNINPLKDEGIELVLANFAEGTSVADIFKLLDPFNVAAVNMAVNKLTPNDDFTFCFVRFSSRQEAEKAIRQVDGKPLLNSSQIVLEYA